MITNISNETNKKVEVVLNEEDIQCFNMMQLSKQLKLIKKIYFDFHKINFEYNIKIFYVKKINKKRVIIFLLVNEKRFTINYDFLYVSNDQVKIQKQELCGNIIEEIIECFQPIKSFKFYSDSLNICGKYTTKHIINDCKKVEFLELNNVLFSLNNENINLFKNYKELRMKDLSLHFQFSKDDSFMEKFNFILENLTNKNINKIDFTIHHDDKFDLTDCNLININNISTVLDIIDFKLNLINTNIKTEYLIKSDELNKFLMRIFLKYSPEFMDISTVEILNSNNSNLNENISIFKYSKIIYTKSFYCLLNSLKNKFKKDKAFSINQNYKILQKIIENLNLKSEDIFEIKTYHLQLMLPNEKSSKFKPIKFLFNLVNDFEGMLSKKIKYEEIYKHITTKPTQDELIKKESVQLKKFDLNSISKILAKIEGNNLISLKDGRKLSIGGKFKKTIKGVEYSQALNTIIEISKNFAKLNIYTFNDNYFLSHFNAASICIDEEFILNIGGLSIEELLPNFAETPVYKINTKDLTIERVQLSESNTLIPGVIFSHKLDRVSDNLIEIKDGFVIQNYTGGLQLIKKENVEPKVEMNSKRFVFNFDKNLWNIIQS